ncbi:Putative gustatory receptor 28b [Trachymyrmex zeteki]|uniref:Putative gustatory receptor 28b n=1 Tax=Mycetomoellerius zeteki TaxID=64791 RepID=A0A151WZ04_9HYME|nr:Putative gustatory receptor 28b [Trachymyrmex zeteki]
MWKKWQLFHATDFQSLMYPCFIFSSILGTFPYKINGSIFETSKQLPVPYIHLMEFQMDMLYMNCVCILKACFKMIDDNLINLRELIINDEPHLLRRIYHEQKNSFLLMELKALKKQHLAISDTVQMLNTIFSLHILATIIMTFSQLTFHLYFYITNWNISMFEDSTIDLFYHIFTMVHTIIYCIKIVLIVWACETGKDRAMKIGITVHDLLNNISDKQITEELQLFSVQILHRENAFSAKGLLVDVTLLIAVNE